LLSGHEVKAVREKHVNLKWSYISLLTGKAVLIWCHISPYSHTGNKKAINPTRPRELLLHQKDVTYLATKQKEKWNTIVPLELYLKWSLVKVRIALAKGRKQYEKKQVLKERDLDREAKSAMKNY
jgi:SsrA-binding protein